MILKYLAMSIMLFCVGAIAVILWIRFFKEKDSSYLILSLEGALLMSIVFVYLIRNPSAWIPM